MQLRPAEWGGFGERERFAKWSGCCFEISLGALDSRIHGRGRNLPEAQFVALDDRHKQRRRGFVTPHDPEDLRLA